MLLYVYVEFFWIVSYAVFTNQCRKTLIVSLTVKWNNIIPIQIYQKTMVSKWLYPVIKKHQVN